MTAYACLTVIINKIFRRTSLGLTRLSPPELVAAGPRIYATRFDRRHQDGRQFAPFLRIRQPIDDRAAGSQQPATSTAATIDEERRLCLQPLRSISDVVPRKSVLSESGSDALAKQLQAKVARLEEEKSDLMKRLARQSENTDGAQAETKNPNPAEGEPEDAGTTAEKVSTNPAAIDAAPKGSPQQTGERKLTSRERAKKERAAVQDTEKVAAVPKIAAGAKSTASKPSRSNKAANSNKGPTGEQGGPTKGAGGKKGREAATGAKTQVTRQTNSIASLMSGTSGMVIAGSIMGVCVAFLFFKGRSRKLKENEAPAAGRKKHAGVDGSGKSAAATGERRINSGTTHKPDGAEQYEDAPTQILATTQNP